MLVGGGLGICMCRHGMAPLYSISGSVHPRESAHAPRPSPACPARACPAACAPWRWRAGRPGASPPPPGPPFVGFVSRSGFSCWGVAGRCGSANTTLGGVDRSDRSNPTPIPNPNHPSILPSHPPTHAPAASPARSAARGSGSPARGPPRSSAAPPPPPAPWPPRRGGPPAPIIGDRWWLVLCWVLGG